MENAKEDYDVVHGYNSACLKNFFMLQNSRTKASYPI